MDAVVWLNRGGYLKINKTNDNRLVDEKDTLMRKIMGCCIQDKDIINQIIVSAEPDE